MIFFMILSKNLYILILNDSRANIYAKVGKILTIFAYFFLPKKRTYLARFF